AAMIDARPVLARPQVLVKGSTFEHVDQLHPVTNAKNRQLSRLAGPIKPGLESSSFRIDNTRELAGFLAIKARIHIISAHDYKSVDPFEVAAEHPLAMGDRQQHRVAAGVVDRRRVPVI